MEKNHNSSKALKIFLGIFAVVVAGVGGYYWWDYEQIKKINAKVVTIEEAQAIANKVLNQ